MHADFIWPLACVMQPSLCLQNCLVCQKNVRMPAPGALRIFNLRCHVLLQIQQELGMTLMPIEQTYIDMATTMIAVGAAKPKSK